MIHGPVNKGNLNLLFMLQQKGLPWPLGAFENRRSFCSIDNVSFVIQQLIEKDIASGIYQIADDEALSTNRLITLMAESQNNKAKIWHIPVKLITLIARLGDFFHLPLNTERLRKLTESYMVSNAKIKQALSIKQMPVSAQELGINQNKIATNSEPWNTKSEASEYVKRYGTVYKLYLVTDAAHMPRALMHFRHAGVKPIPAPTNFNIRQNNIPKNYTDYFPSSGNIRYMEIVFLEYLGMLWAKMGGN